MSRGNVMRKIGDMLAGATGGIGGVLFFCLGVVQLLALIAGMEAWLGLHWLLSGILLFPIAYIPIFGTVCAIMGAVKGWGWTWWQAGLLFFGLQIVMLAIISVAMAFESGRASLRRT